VQDDWTPLRLAAIMGHARCVELLLGKGATVRPDDEVSGGLQGLW
jgi:ankyrin repeat protein